MAQRYWLTLAQTASHFHRVVSVIEARDLAQAEGKATRALRALRLTHDQGARWNRWVIAAHTASSQLPHTAAMGDENGTTWSTRFTSPGAGRGHR